MQRKVVKVSAGELHTFMATSDGMLYAVGDNNDTTLGVGPRSDLVVHPRPVLMPSTSKGLSNSSNKEPSPGTSPSSASSSPLGQAAPVSIVPSNSSSPYTSSSLSALGALDMDTLGRHTLALSEEGKVFSWGSSSEGQLGHGMCEPSHIPRLILSLEGIKIVQVECGWSHSLCLSADGRVFAFGNGDDGKLGLGNTLDFVVPFTVNYFINNNIRIKHISAGHFHSAAVDDDGFLYTWGSGVCSVLGHGNYDRQLTPKRVILWQLCADGAHSAHHGAFVPWNGHEDEKVPSPRSPTKPNGSTWKRASAKGKDGVEENQGDSNPQLVLTPPTTPSKRVKQESYSPAISSPFRIQDHTIEWEDEDRVVSIASGAFHMMAATMGGRCFTWGKGDTFALGHNNTQDAHLPTQVHALKNHHISKVACSMNHSMALADLDPIDDPTSSINLNRPGMVSSTPTYESKVHLYFSSSLGSTPTPKSGQFFVPTSPSPQLPPTQPSNAPGIPISFAISSPGVGGFSKATSRIPNDATISNAQSSSQSNATSSSSNHEIHRPTLSQDFEESTVESLAEIAEFAKTASEMRVLGISTTASAFEKAIYGTVSTPKASSILSEVGRSPSSSSARRPSVGASASVSGASVSASGTSSGPGSDSDSPRSPLKGSEAAPASKPMRISKIATHQRRAHTVQPDDDFPNIATTFRNTIMDTAEYSLVSGRVDAEVAQLKFMLDSSLGSRGESVDATGHRYARSEKITRPKNRFERRSSGHADHSNNSDQEMDSSSSDDNVEELLDGDPFSRGSSLVSDPSEGKIKTARDGSIGLDASLSSVPPSPRTGSYTVFQDQSSTASSPVFRSGPSNATSPLMDDDAEVLSNPSKASEALSPEVDTMPPSPLKFGFTKRVPAPEGSELEHNLTDDEDDFSPRSDAAVPTTTRHNDRSKGEKHTSKTTGSNSKRDKKKEKKSKSSGRSTGGGAARFGQLVEDFFRKNGNDPNRRAARLDSVQHEMNHKNEKMDSLSDVWLVQLMPRWDTARRTRNAKKIWRRGIPANIRGVVWSFLIRNDLSLDFNVYDAALRSSQLRYKLWLDGEDQDRNVRSGQSPFHVIDVDVPRTHPETKLFKPGGPFHGDLVSLLHVYAAFDREMSYVQGMSYLAAFFVTHCVDPFTAFRCFANLLNTHFFRNLFRMNLTQILRHMSAYELLFERHLPQLFAHFKALCITPEQYLLDWFMTCFSRAFSLQIASRIFDCLIIEGEIVLYRTALAILKVSEHMLLDTDFEQLLPMFRTIAREIDEDTLFATIDSIKVPREVRDFIRKIALDPLN